MWRARTLAFLLSWTLACGGTERVPPPDDADAACTPPQRPGPDRLFELPTRGGGERLTVAASTTAASARALVGDGECRSSAEDPHYPAATLTWATSSTAVAAGAVQRVMVTTALDFEGAYALSGELEPTATRLEAGRMAGGSAYRWRVVTRLDGVWIPSETGHILAPSCPVDWVGCP